MDQIKINFANCCKRGRNHFTPRTKFQLSQTNVAWGLERIFGKGAYSLFFKWHPISNRIVHAKCDVCNSRTLTSMVKTSDRTQKRDHVMECLKNDAELLEVKSSAEYVRGKQRDLMSGSLLDFFDQNRLPCYNIQHEFEIVWKSSVTPITRLPIQPVST